MAIKSSQIQTAWGAKLLRGKVLDSRLRGHGFESQRRPCVVSFSKTHLSLLSTCSTHEEPSQHNWGHRGFGYLGRMAIYFQGAEEHWLLF